MKDKLMKFYENHKKLSIGMLVVFCLMVLGAITGPAEKNDPASAQNTAIERSIPGDNSAANKADAANVTKATVPDVVIVDATTAANKEAGEKAAQTSKKAAEQAVAQASKEAAEQAAAAQASKEAAEQAAAAQASREAAEQAAAAQASREAAEQEKAAAEQARIAEEQKKSQEEAKQVAEQTGKNVKEEADKSKTKTPASPTKAISITSGMTFRRNQYATISIIGQPGAQYTITVHYNSGPSKAKGLEPKTADANGNVSWTWKIGGNTSEGTYRVDIQGNGDIITDYFTVEVDE